MAMSTVEERREILKAEYQRLEHYLPHVVAGSVAASQCL
jgi:hypothetical protein